MFLALDFQDAFDAYKEEMAEVHESMEIATLDKEMAEEKVKSPTLCLSSLLLFLASPSLLSDDQSRVRLILQWVFSQLCKAPVCTIQEL